MLTQMCSPSPYGSPEVTTWTPWTRTRRGVRSSVGESSRHALVFGSDAPPKSNVDVFRPNTSCHREECVCVCVSSTRAKACGALGHEFLDWLLWAELQGDPKLWTGSSGPLGFIKVPLESFKGQALGKPVASWIVPVRVLLRKNAAPGWPHLGGVTRGP